MANEVRAASAAVQAMGRGWPTIDALLGGTLAMRDAGKKHLPKWPSEPQDAYDNRLASATLFPAFQRTVEVLGGKPFSKPLTLSKEVPARIQDWAEDIDMQGRDLHAFAAGTCHAALSHGLAGILVDYPKARGVRTKADEQAKGLRPYFVEIKAGDILGWRSKRENGAEVLTQLRFLESVVDEAGPFGEKIVEQVRVLYPGKWEVWREKKDAAGDEKWFLHEKGTTSLKKIPFVPVYGKRTGFMQCLPPLLELAHLNVEHWQSKSDQQTILHVARVPILFAKMLGKAEIVVGGASAVNADHEHADMKFVEHSGAAIEAGRLSLRDLEDLMRQVGAELLVIKPGNTTVAQTLSDDNPGMCTLQSIVQNQETAIENALALMCEWVNEKPAGDVSIYQDFGVSSLAEASLELLFEMNIAGTFSDESLYQEAQRRGVIRDEIAWADEKKRIALNAPKETAPAAKPAPIKDAAPAA